MDQGGGGTWKVNSGRDGPKVLVSEVERGYLEEAPFEEGDEVEKD
jgi:hypothetical protein